MNDNAHVRLLNRRVAERRVAPLASAGLPLLVDAVDAATWLLQRCRASAAQMARSRPQPYEDASSAPLLLYLHIIEMTDSAAVLLAQGCVEPVELLQRSAFEAVVSLRFITASKAEFERRGLAWMIHHARNRIRWCENTDATTKRGTDFAAAWKRERGTEWPLQSSTAEADELRAYLREAHVAPLDAEFETLSAKRRGRPVAWYQLFGPENMRDLAREVRMEAEYLNFYPLFSGITHAGDLTRFISATTLGDIEPLRRSDKFVQVFGLTLRLLEYGSEAVETSFRPAEPQSQLRDIFGRRANATMAQLRAIAEPPPAPQRAG